MPRLGLGILAIGVLALFTATTAQKGCQDLVKSATHLRYFPIRDMRYSVVINPQKVSMRLPDTTSVPTTGREPDPGRDVLAATLVNPTAPAELDSSVARGTRKFAVTCVPCHGKSMAGDGTVAALFMPPPDLLAQVTRERTDGFLYSYIRHGGIVMPSYGAQVTRQEAWDVINYVRHMQKVSPR
ncbi:MAG: cytochrome c [Candidatus Eisenbacteria bacterium]|nr:cytochrome c [Candidatus Eisenbacteria bacterium]